MTEAPKNTTDPNYQSRVYQWYLVIVSLLVVMTSSIDRSILSLLVEPIRQDLKISDFKISLLGGLAFSLFYAVCAIPIGRLVDQLSRPIILAIGITVWSLATLGSGLAFTFAALFVMRMTVAIGEATATPCSVGMVTDVFMGRSVGRMIAIVMLGAVFGPSVALIGGGLILDALKGVDYVSLPFGLNMKPWQVAFAAAAVPGLILAPVILYTIKDPIRQRVVRDAEGKPVRPSFKALVSFIRDHKRTVLCHAFGYAVWSLGDKSVTFWAPTFLVRHHDMDVSMSGYLFGGIFMATTVIGNLTVGYLVDRATTAGNLDAALRVGRNLALAGIAPMFLFPFMPTLWSSLLVLIVGLLCASGYATVTIAQQQFAPNQVRAQYTGLYLLVSNVVGGVIGTSLVAVLTELVFQDRNMIGYSLAIVGAGGFAFAGVILSFGIKSYGESMADIGERARDPVPVATTSPAPPANDAVATP